MYNYLGKKISHLKFSQFSIPFFNLKNAYIFNILTTQTRESLGPQYDKFIRQIEIMYNK